MRTGRLLERLISIAQIAKTDFALSLNMTPSGLSKILTGKRLPHARERHAFSKQASHTLADAIYGINCYLKFEGLFPVLYDFGSKPELELFLAHAIEYALGEDFAAENGDRPEYPDKEAAYLGKKEVLNMFCLLVSDILTSGTDGHAEFHSTLPLLGRQYADIFGRLKFNHSDRLDGVVLNQYIEIRELESSFDEFDIGALAQIVDAESRLSLNLWRADARIEHRFLLVRGRVLLQFSRQLDGAPLMTLIRHKGYLAVFCNAFSKLPVKKISHTSAEALACLDENPAFLQSLASRGFDAVYNTLSIGYMLEKSDMTPEQGANAVTEPMLEIFKSILRGDTLFHVTLDAMLNIAATGRAVLPLVDTVELPPEERIAYLQRFQHYIDDRSRDKVRVINGTLPNATFLCARRLTLIYIVNGSHTREKIHLLETDIVRNILDGELARHGMSLYNFSIEMWDAYIEHISNALPR